MKTILVTAFEPFGGSEHNSSLDTLRSLPDEIDGVRIQKAEIPVEYVRSGEVLAGIVKEIPEDELCAILCLGQAEGRASITPEYIAVNVRNASIPDNAGQLCRYEPIDPEGDAGIFATIPVVKIAERLNAKNIPASVSFTAGAYVCNSLMYAALSSANPNKVPAGFIHLPLSAEIAKVEGKTAASLAQSVLTKGIVEAISEVIGKKE